MVVEQCPSQSSKPDASVTHTLHLTSYSHRLGPLVSSPMPALTIDVRALQNPSRALRKAGHTGVSPLLRQAFFEDPKAAARLLQAREEIGSLLRSVEERCGGKPQEVAVGVCCEHGRNRSVAIVEELGQGTDWPTNWNVVVRHRDVDKKEKRKEAMNAETS